MGSMALQVEVIGALFVFACLLSFVIPDYQGDALYALRLSLNASANQLSDWNPNQVNPCTWSNVMCDSSYSVVAVTLSSMGFSGVLSSRLGVLKDLSTLSLQGNGITGEIPEEFGNLSSLTSLDLENNRLSGGIPSSLGNLSNLKYLILSHNNHNGEIPDSLLDLSNLISLQVSSNELTGQIPDKLFTTPKYNFTGNKLNCGGISQESCASDDDSIGSSNKKRIGIIVGVVGALVGVTLIAGSLFFVYKVRCRVTNVKTIWTRQVCFVSLLIFL